MNAVRDWNSMEAQQWVSDREMKIPGAPGYKQKLYPQGTHFWGIRYKDLWYHFAYLTFREAKEVCTRLKTDKDLKVDWNFGKTPQKIARPMNTKLKHPEINGGHGKKEEPDALFVSACSFKRTQKSPLEFGVMINEDGLIIDMKGKPVEGLLYSYKCMPHEGAFIVRNKF